jgi:osmotically-inducible protein OsmY
VKDAANAQAKSIDAQADAAKAQIEADKAKADAAMKQQEKNVDQASQKIQNAVGSAQQSVSGNQTDDNQLLNEAKAQVQNDTNVNVTVDNGIVTLNGTVNSDQEKTSLENRVKQVRGVQDVKNNLDVKSQ